MSGITPVSLRFMQRRHPLVIAVVLTSAFCDPDIGLETGELSPVLKLPDVQSVMTKATDRIQDLAKHTEEIYRQVADQNRQNKNFLMVRKERFERNLTDQAERNRLQVQQNRVLHNRLLKLQEANVNRRTHVEDLRRNVALLRATFAALRGKLGMAQEYIEESLKQTDMSDIEQLPELEPPKPRPSLKRLLASVHPETLPQHHKENLRVMMLQAAHAAATSTVGTPEFLGIEIVPVAEESLESYVRVLQHGLQDLHRAQLQGEAQLTAKYIKMLSNGDAAYSDLKAMEGQLLNGTKIQEQVAEQLHAASRKLTQFHADLSQRIRGLGSFAQQLGTTASKAIVVVDSATGTSDRSGNATNMTHALADKEADMNHRGGRADASSDSPAGPTVQNPVSGGQAYAGDVDGEDTPSHVGSRPRAGLLQGVASIESPGDNSTSTSSSSSANALATPAGLGNNASTATLSSHRWFLWG